MTNTLKTIELWHRRARPEPTPENFNVQLGCHLEELGEMLATMEPNSTAARAFTELKIYVNGVAAGLKVGLVTVTVLDRKELLDSLADQVVTAVGVGHCTGMNVPSACERVDESNWSKLTDGKFTFDANGKIMKPSTYQPPNLEGLW